MPPALLGAVVWVAVSIPVALGIGRAIRVADRRSARRDLRLVKR
jgi:hypothetical protein